MRETTRQHLLAIFREGVAAVQPSEAVKKHVTVRGEALIVGGRRYDLGGVRHIFVVGAGKAAAHIAHALEEILAERIAKGWVNVKTGHTLKLRKVHIHEAGHPVPDQAGVRGAREIVGILEDAREDDLVFCCLTGGGSALLPLPADGVSLEDKQALTRQLLACGANINDVNAVRKHLSRLKGGQLARLAQPAQLIALILSDVIGDPLDTIASGPTAPDATTFAEALAVLRRYGIEERVPGNVLEYLRAGAAGNSPETPKPGDAMFSRVANLIVANNGAAVEGCGRKATELGYHPLVLSTRTEGEAREVARSHVAVARKVLRHGRPVAPPACIISSGETTVTVRGDGLGGRNQEFALASALAVSGTDGIAILAAGTDGTDGPTDAAGAFADGTTCERAAQISLEAGDYLARNDAYHFFDAVGDLLRTGPTGTNVMDLYLFLVGSP